MNNETSVTLAPLHPQLPLSEFDWITDKNLLRDEGVYFGLSDSDQIPAEKVDTIRQFFQERIKALETNCASKRNSAAETKQRVERTEANIEAQKVSIQQLKDTFVVNDHDFWRHAIGVIIYIIVLIFNFGLIYSWLTSANIQSPISTTLGVYLFGSLSLFSQFSLLYHSNKQVLETEGHEREPWKVYLEEFGIPLIASAYISLKGASSHGSIETIVFFLLIYSLFLFAGKGFLTQLVKAKKEWTKMAGNYIGKRALHRQIVTIEDKIQQNELELEKINNTLQSIQEQILEDEKSIAMIYEQKETNVLLFLSEYELAKSARQTLNRKQISQIISSRR